MPGSEQVVSFAVYKAYVAAYASGAAATWTEIPLAKEGTINLNVNMAEVTDGEGVLYHNFYHTQRATGSLRCARAAMRVIELITGNGSSSAVGTEIIAWGTDAEIQAPLMRLLFIAKAEDSDGNTGYFEVYVWKARGRMNVINLAETTAAETVFEFTCFRSTKDTAGNNRESAMGSIQLLRSSAATTEMS